MTPNLTSEAVRTAGDADTSSLPTRSDPRVPVRIHGAPPPPRTKRGRPRRDERNTAAELPEKLPIQGNPPDEPPKRRGHALDFAPVHSKLVKTDQGCVLAIPEGARILPPEDIANALPVGAKIFKAAEGRYVSEQLSPDVDRPPTVHATAIEAISAFLAYFHPSA